MSNIPNWVEQLKKGDEIVVVFPTTGVTLFADVVENYPRSDSSLYFGTLTVEYLWNDVARQDDLLYDDYSSETTNLNNWFAYQVT